MLILQTDVAPATVSPWIVAVGAAALLGAGVTVALAGRRESKPYFAKLPSGEHWVTMGGHPEGERQHVGGRPVLLDGEGRIVGGALPHFFQGMTPEQTADSRYLGRSWRGTQQNLQTIRTEIAKMERERRQAILREEREGRQLSDKQHLIDEVRRVTGGDMIRHAPHERRGPDAAAVGARTATRRGP